MIPYMVGKLAPISSHLTRGLVKYVPGRGYFRAVSSQNGDKFVITPPPPPIVERVERRTSKIREAFSRTHRALDGWMLARAPASPAQGLHHHRPLYFNFPHFCTMCDLEEPGLVDQNWLERDLSVLLLRTLVVGRRQQFESIEAALDME